VILFKNRRRRKLRSRPFLEAWRSILESEMPLYRRLPVADRAELEGHIQVFIAEKYFEGCNGQSIDDRIRVLVAAHACLLLLHRDTDYFPLMRSVLVYPAAFVSTGKSIGPAGTITENAGWRAGESWHTPIAGGPVIISWRDTVAGAQNPCDGRNLALHEFAHQLDGESGVMDGVPALDAAASRAFARTLEIELSRFRHALSLGLPTAIDPYGAQSPAEFFACAVEAFFERSLDVRAAHPDLYRQLAAYFNQDPTTWAACTRADALPGAVA
jgi:Mlc titration factor MtfA (ptsG expression regulator)